jgi:hydroxymethylglutaryl-CoA synthase
VQESGILSVAGYLPKLRMAREAIAENVKWANPGIVGLGKGCGHRS